MSEKLINLVRQKFQKQFEDDPKIVFSPGRINLIGEHTDYNEGLAFPAAIDKGIALAIGKSKSTKSIIYALNKEESYDFDLSTIKALDKGDWKNYPLGIIGELKALGKQLQNFNAVFAGNISGGAGMSSSAALENAFVFGFNHIFDLGLSKREMIFISQKAEHNYVGVKCGIMDQYASMFGKNNSALLLDCRSTTAETFKIDFKDYKLILINTNVKHDLSESAYNERRLVCEKVSLHLNIKSLRDASKKDLDGAKEKITSDDYDKALYVISEISRVKKFAEAIKKNNIIALGNLLYQSHHGLSEHYKVSCEELDFLVEQAKENSNVLGARMMGGGFGGCTINLVKKEELRNFENKVSENFRNKFNKECSVCEVKLSKGTHLVNY